MDDAIYYALCRKFVLRPGSQHTMAELARVRAAAVRPFVTALFMVIGSISFVSGVAVNIAAAYSLLGRRIYGILCVAMLLTLVSKRISSWRTTRLAALTRPATLYTRLSELFPALASFKQLALEDLLFKSQPRDCFDDRVSLVLAELATSITKLAAGISAYIAATGLSADHSGSKLQQDIVQLLMILEPTTTACMGLARNIGHVWELVHLDGILAAKLTAGGIDAASTCLVTSRASACVEMAGARFRRPDSESVAVSIDHLSIRPGKLVAVTGTVGAGKSALLLAMVGELELVSGMSCSRGSIAYVGQSPWIMGATIEENVLLGRPLCADRYTKTLDLCCLDEDTHQMVGDIYILDDTLASLDARVRDAIWRRVISSSGELRHRIRVMATNDPTYIEQCDTIVHVAGGMARVLRRDASNAIVTNLPHPAPAPMLGADDRPSVAAAGQDEDRSQARDRLSSRASGPPAHKSTPSEALSYYIRVCGAGTLVLAAGMGLATFGLPVMLYQRQTALLRTRDDKHMVAADVLQRYAWSVIVSTIVTISLGWMQLAVQEWLYIELNRPRLHHALLSSLAHTQMAEFWRVGSLQVLSVVSFSERAVFLGLHSFIADSATQLAAIAFSAYSTFQISGDALVVLAIAAAGMKHAMRHSSGVLLAIQRRKRKKTQQREAIVHCLFSGALTVRVFRAYDLLEPHIWGLGRMVAGIERLATAVMSTRTFYLDAIQELLAHLLVGAVALRTGRGASMGVAGVRMYHDLLARALPLLQDVIVMGGEAKNHLLALQELCDTTNLAPEGPRYAGRRLALGGWPAEGGVEFSDCSLRYAAGEGLALDRVSFSVRPGERIGIVGRTGSGKSSLINALLRIVELESGTVLIDGVDASHVGLHGLRRQISVVPQAETLLEGTLRSNLDPLNEHSDADVWDAAQDAGLEALGLGMRVESCGRNLSAGQQQLVAVCRALLRQCRIVVLDEATARIDEETARRVRSLIRHKAAGCTVLTIAHQLDAVRDSDRILVMDGGRVAEFGAPAVLASQRGLYFRLLEASAGRPGTGGLADGQA
ncbi:hypothetical protein LPJ61_000022 [Coemansia biformis]|uniref:ABC transporter domain-containing protein n=1 Tax=Coemansia biformis TaxID=1286918 RepID=A0A9W7YCB6_9FUNG|nr:hypothetical protein LPJ61_000022 [Coemansia biformis]